MTANTYLDSLGLPRDDRGDEVPGWGSVALIADMQRAYNTAVAKGRQMGRLTLHRMPPACSSTGLYLTVNPYMGNSLGVRGGDLMRMFRAYACAVGNERLFTPDWHARTCPTCGTHRCVVCERKHRTRRCCR